MNKKTVVFFLTISFLGHPIVHASSTDAFTKINSETELIDCLSQSNMCELNSNITSNSKINVTGNTILDLNGFSITPSNNLTVHNGLITVNRGSKLTITDSKKTGKISTGNSGKVWAGIELASETPTEGVAELIINSGTIEGYYYGIVGNGKHHNTNLTINGGTIKTLYDDDSVGIYLPQIGKTEINGGIISGGTGIEIRSGDLTINNATITGSAKTFTKTANKNGTTTNGVGLTIAQHTTKNPINVTINNATITGQYALYEWNPHHNTEINKVKITINNGDFKTTLSDGFAIYSENFTKFIKGGKFNSDVTKYLTNDAKTTTKLVSKEITNTTKSKSRPWILITIGIIIIIISLTYYFFTKYKSKIK